jgi:predicted amidohydrolase YtcJ
LRAALAAYTAGSAYANHCDDRTGTIAVGRLADVVVLDRDVLEAADIGDLRAVLTMVGGVIVHEAA